MATPHISAEPGDFAPDVLMPGDPRRAWRIAETVLQDVRQVTEVRGILGYTGTFDGRPVSVLASGMGMPSMAIYATELFRFYDVQRIIRIGTAGGMAPHLDLGDVVIASAAHTDSAMADSRIPGVRYSHAPSFALAAAAAAAAGVVRPPAQPAVADPAAAGPAGGDAATGQTATGVTAAGVRAAGKRTAGEGTTAERASTGPGAGRRRRRARAGQVYVGPVFSSDSFYAERPRLVEQLVAHGTLAIEMEAAALYATADAEGGQALAICTISDLLFRDAALPAAGREVLFDRSVALGLAAFAHA